MTSKHNIFYAAISGLLLCLPWYDYFSGLGLCIALVPLLQIEDVLFKTPHRTTKSVFLYTSLTFFLWNLGTTWWITNASLAGALAAIIINTFLYTTVFSLYHITRKVAGNLTGKIALIAYWVGFEYFYLNAEISWPWLNLGNGFGHDVRLVQWYEYTGALGGTVWVLVTNLVIFETIKLTWSNTTRKKIFTSLLTCLLTVFLPIILSEIQYNTYAEKSNPCRIVAIQPNVDPYNETLSVVSQCTSLLHLADSSDSSGTDYFVAPEVCIRDNVWENSPENNYSVPLIQKFIRRYPQSAFVYGTNTYRKFANGEVKSPTAQYSKFQNFFFDSYNTAVQLDTSNKIQLYHKSKLVVGVEKMPYPRAFKFLQRTIENLGGSFISYGSQQERTVFESTQKRFRIAPVICYESVYGEFVTNYIKHGANLIFVITNDGWWGDTPGYKQHLGFSRLRAIETRRSIARSANTGISAFINQRGDIINALEWGRKGALTGIINANDYQTCYTIHGDYIGYMANFVSAGIALFTLFVFISKRKSR